MSHKPSSGSSAAREMQPTGGLSSNHNRVGGSIQAFLPTPHFFKTFLFFLSFMAKTFLFQLS